jgi:predicted dehydrogenase
MKRKIISTGKKKMTQYTEGGIKEVITGTRKIFKAAIIGTGAHSRNNILNNIQFLPLEVTAVCAAHKENASFYGKKFGASAFYDDYNKMLEKEKPDLILCCINAEEHTKVIKLALEKNIPLFTEKPAAKSSEDLKKIIDHKNKKKIMVGFQKRFVPNYQFIKKTIEDKKVGPVHYLQMELGVGAYPADLNEFLLEIGIHFVDLLRYFIPDVQFSEIKKIDAGNGKMNVSVSFNNNRKVIGNLLLSSNFNWENCHERIFINFDQLNIEVENLVDLTITPNSKTFLNIPIDKVIKKTRYKNRWYPNYISGTPENSSPAQSGFLPELQYFIDAVIKKGKNEISNLDNAYRTHLMLEKIIHV